MGVFLSSLVMHIVTHFFLQAVGCLLYEMCALYPPFEGQSLIGLFFNIVKAEFRVSMYENVKF